MTDTATHSPDTVSKPAVKGRTLLDTALLRLKRNRAAMLSLWVVIIMTLAAIFGPLVSPHPYHEVYNLSLIHI